MIADGLTKVLKGMHFSTSLIWFGTLWTGIKQPEGFGYWEPLALYLFYPVPHGESRAWKKSNLWKQAELKRNSMKEKENCQEWSSFSFFKLSILIYQKLLQLLLSRSYLVGYCNRWPIIWVCPLSATTGPSMYPCMMGHLLVLIWYISTQA
jgi:hypothetical protein